MSTSTNESPKKGIKLRTIEIIKDISVILTCLSLMSGIFLAFRILEMREARSGLRERYLEKDKKGN